VEPTEQQIVANGLEHHVLVWGDDGSPTIVLCHGFLDLAWSWGAVGSALAEMGFRAVAFDWRGHGETQHVGAGGYYYFPDYVLDLHELVPQVSSGALHLVGHSMGATAVLLYAATHPKVLRTLTVIEGLGPPDFEHEAPDKMLTWLDSMDRFRRREVRPMRDLADAVKRMRAQTPELPIELAYMLAEKSTEPIDEGGLVWRFDAMHRTTSPMPFSMGAFSSFLKRVEAPTLVVMGSRGFRTKDHEERFAMLRTARSLELEDVGHMIHWLKPRELATAIAEQVRSV
jgi:pimeloyl-ACP methyl ester carboxylesterase